MLHDAPDADPLSPAQVEAKKILSFLVDELSNDNCQYYARYGAWIQSHPTLAESCFRHVQPQVWNFLDGRWSLDALKMLGGDLKHAGPGVYLNGVLGLDRRVRIYIGQANSIRPRIAQHLNFRYRRDNPSLHYHAMQHSIYNSMGIIALLPSPSMENNALPGMDRPDLLLNLLEMWMCLVFRTLPTQTLEEWLPDDKAICKKRKEGREGEFGGLNIASPLHHGNKERVWVDLSESDDPLVKDFLGPGRKLLAKQQTNPRDNETCQIEHADTADTPEARKKAYREYSRSFNKYMNVQRAEPSQTLGMLFALGIGIAIGAALLRTVGRGSHPR